MPLVIIVEGVAGLGKRCLEAGRAAGKADAGSRAQQLIAAWQAEASGDVADRLAALALAEAGEDHAAPQQLRQGW